MSGIVHLNDANPTTLGSQRAALFVVLLERQESPYWQRRREEGRRWIESAASGLRLTKVIEIDLPGAQTIKVWKGEPRLDLAEPSPPPARDHER